MAEIGKISVLKVVRTLESGVYLDGGALGKVFMPRGYLSGDCRSGDLVEVFIFPDAGDRLLATTSRPYAVVGDFALLKVASLTPAGAFLDWGLKKDLLVPFSEQREKMVEGRSYLVHVYLDEKRNRIVASSKLGRFLDKDTGEFQEGQPVDLLIFRRTGIGYTAIINNSRQGMLYKNETFQPLSAGQRVRGFIKKVRTDGKIDLCLQKPGREKVDDVADKIMDMLKKRKGFISVTDKSPPDVIYRLFGASKKTFKKAIGALYKDRLIVIEQGGIRLAGNP
jgi:predicted RNA-binding protein (virulence factor B family)